MARKSNPAGEKAAVGGHSDSGSGDGGGVVVVVFTEHGITKTYTAPASKTWDIVARADKRFGIVEDTKRWAQVSKKWL